MALKTFATGTGWRVPDDVVNESATATSVVVDATGEAVALIYQSPIAGEIASITFRLGGVTTGDVISIEVQTVTTTSGIPSDTLWAAGTAISFSLTTTMANTWQTVNLSAVAAVSIGDTLAIVIKRADVAGGGVFNVNRIIDSGERGNMVSTKTLGVWTKNNQSHMAIFPLYSGVAAVASNSRFIAYIPNVIAVSAGANPDEIGNILNFPFRTRAVGYWYAADFSVGGVSKLRLYNTDGTTVMASRVIDHDIDGGSLNFNMYEGYFESATVLAADSNYRIAIFCSTGAIGVTRLSAANATAMGTMHMGSLCYATSRVNAGAWTDSIDARVMMGLIIDQLDDSSASGGAAGGLAHIIGSQ